jgi:hypothetical protein
MQLALMAHRAGAGGLRAGADRHRDGERTWVECNLGVDGLCSVTSLVVSSVQVGCGLVVGVDGRGQKSEDSPCFPAPYKHYGFYTTYYTLYKRRLRIVSA